MKERAAILTLSVAMIVGIVTFAYTFWPFNQPPVMRLSGSERDYWTERLDRIESAIRNSHTELALSLQAVDSQIDVLDGEVSTLKEVLAEVQGKIDQAKIQENAAEKREDAD